MQVSTYPMHHGPTPMDSWNRGGRGIGALPTEGPILGALSGAEVCTHSGLGMGLDRLVVSPPPFHAMCPEPHGLVEP